MSKPKVAVVIGSTRATRFADAPAEWIAKLAAKHSEWEVELVDLRDYPMPFFDEAASSLWAPSKNEVAQRWQKKVDEFDAFIFTASEYTHGPSAVLKNALDYAYTEWNKKPVGFVGYGGVGGARAIEQLRLPAIELQMVPVRTAVHIVWADYMAVKGGTKLSELEHVNQAADDMLNQLSWYTHALKTARDADLATADVEAA